MAGTTDMPTNGAFDPETKYVQLGERVENQARQIADIDVRMRQGFTEIGSQIRTLSDDVRGGAKTPWPIIIGFSSVVITILGGLGYLALQPIKDNLSQIREDAKIEEASTKSSFATIVDRMVSVKEMEWRTARGAEDRKRTDDAIVDLRGATVSRNEWSERNHARDNEIAEIRRRLDEIRQDVGSQYTTRDVLLSTQSEVKDLRNQLRALYEASGRVVR